jgi:putative glutamine amidotransferase
MSSVSHKPVIGLPADLRHIDGLPFHAVGDKYLRAIAEAAGGLPLIIPAFGDLHDLPDLVRRLDGILLTGSPSNVHPTYYGVAATPEHKPHDEARDETTLPLIDEVLNQGVPMLAICRGMQELNVALGGTLHARVHELPERLDHRRPQHDDMDVQYGPRHTISLMPDGILSRLAGSTELEVNSLHWQALDEVAPRLRIEALAPDGTVEAVSVRDARNFALGVQWHPEYRALDNPFSATLFTAFGASARERAEARATGRPPRQERQPSA